MEKIKLDKDGNEVKGRYNTDLKKDVYDEDVVLGPCRRCGKKYESCVDDGICNPCWDELDSNSGWSF